MDTITAKYNKIYTFLLLVLIVDATANDSNETSYERRQSRVTGRIVKLYSGTRPEPILCAGEGFQADPHDCAVFYRCMKSGNGKYTVFRFQCGPGTVYDPENEVCNHPRSTKRSECGGLSPPSELDREKNNEIEGMQHEIPSPIMNKPIYTNIPIHVESTTHYKESKGTTSNSWVTSTPTINTSTKRQILEDSSVLTSTYPWGSIMNHPYPDHTIKPLNIVQNTVSENPQYNEVHTVSLPTTPTDPQSSSQNNICTSDGFMGDSENCRKFYRCVANQRGSYTKYEFSCSESTIWDDDTQGCNHAWAVKRSRCGRSNLNKDKFINQNAFVTTEKTKTPQKSENKTIQQQLQISYGTKVTQTQTQISNGPVIQNQTQINYGDRINKTNGTEAKQNQSQVNYGSAISQTQTQIDYNDKGVQTQLQIDHSQQSSQSQVQVHESTTTGTSISTAHSTTYADDSNKCAMSGFMGDAKDCKKFYRCIDNGKGGYTKFEFSCGDGTVWDQSIEACNHAWAVKECGGNSHADTTSSTQAATGITISTQNYYTTISTENYHMTSGAVATEDNEDSGYVQENLTTVPPTTSSFTTAGPSTTISSSNENCQFSGFMGDTNDCKIFYRCVENGKGSFTKYEFKCGEGTVWDPDLEACNHAWAVKKCGGTATPDVEKVEPTSEKSTTHFVVSTQSTSVNNSTTELTAIQNDDNDSGYVSVNNDFTTTTTTSTQKPQNLDHNVGNNCQSSGFLADNNDCKKFYRCVDNGNGEFIRYEFTCGEGTVWDSEIEACNHAWAVEKCGGSVSVANNQETTTYSKPTTQKDGSSSTESDLNTSSLTPITGTTLINISTTTESLTGGSSDCTYSGFIGDQNDCKKFYRCVDNGNKSYTKYEFACGEGTVWDQEIEACNHAWAVKTCGGSNQSLNGHPETTTQYHPTMSDEVDNGYPSNVDLGPDITTQNITTSSTTEGSKYPGNNCVNNGFIGDKNDCKKFYRCVDDGKGGFIRYEFSCGEGTLWDQSIEACNHAWAVSNCNAENDIIVTPSGITAQVTSTSDQDQGHPTFTDRTSTSTTSNYQDNEISNNICSEEGFFKDKNDCKKFYRCVDNGQGGFTKYEFKCGKGTYWNQEILSCDHASPEETCGEKDSGSTSKIPQYEHDEMYTETTTMSSPLTTEIFAERPTQKPQPSSGVCISEGFYGDENNCKQFYRCVDDGKGNYTKYEFTCGDGTVWDQEIQGCNHESSNKNCSSSSRPPTPETTEHTSEYEDNSSASTSSQTQRTTEKTESSSSSSTSKQCTSEGFFPDPSDCKKFIRCVSNDKGGYTKYEFSCGEGTIWVQDILACDHDTEDTSCSSQTTTKPLTSEGYPQTTKPLTSEEYPQTTENQESSSSTPGLQTVDKQEDEYDNESGDKPSHSGSDLCTSEGFYGNKNDCRQFYRCVDNGQGGYTKYDFTCGEGTAWDSDIQTCNHIDEVKTCQGNGETHPVMHDEENAQTAESSSTMKTTLSESSHDSSSGNKGTCDSEGYFGNSKDCKKFYRCVDNGNGGYTKHDYTCGEGTIWDQDITTCNHPQDVVNPSCKQNQQADISTTTVTTASSSSSVSSEGTTSTTEDTHTNSSNCSQEETTKKPENQNVTCTKAGYYGNPNDCKKFYRCVDWDGDGKRFSVYHFDCGEGTIWDPAVETCNHEESVYPPRVCDGSQSQSENQPPTTETTTISQETTSTPQNITSTTQSSTEQITQPSTSEQTTVQETTPTALTTTEQTTTEQSTTSEQTTTLRSTTSQQMTTEKSTTTEEITTQVTTTEKTTQSSSSDQTTQPSATSEQTTTPQDSTTLEQMTQPPTTTEQTTQPPTSSEQTTSELTTTQRSTTSEPTTTEQSDTSQQTTQEPTTSELTTTQKSTTSEPTTTEQSSTSQQTTQDSTTSEQATQESTTTELPTSPYQTTMQQATSDSTTEQFSSTAESSSTDQGSSQQSTTTEQSEQSTPQESTSTEGTTTEESNLDNSTTEQANESSTTESSTDENSSDKKCPETDKSQNLFVCPTSFRRHPKYCNLFYQCDEDDDTHDVKVAVFTCPNNTIYDESQIRCVEESKTDNKCNGQIAQNRRLKRLNKDYKEPIVVTKDSFVCPSTGYFPFERDSECSPAFLRCKTDKTNRLRGLVYQCPTGYIYWSTSKRCESISSVRDCKRSHNNWTGRWEIPVERRNVAPA